MDLARIFRSYSRLFCISWPFSTELRKCRACCSCVKRFSFTLWIITSPCKRPLSDFNWSCLRRFLPDFFHNTFLRIFFLFKFLGVWIWWCSYCALDFSDFFCWVGSQGSVVCNDYDYLLRDALGAFAQDEDIIYVLLFDGHFKPAVLLSKHNRKLADKVIQNLWPVNFVIWMQLKLWPLFVICSDDVLGCHYF